jgi:hypothetical protein
MQSIEVGYFECAGCLSLQTEKPYWLERAYATPRTGSLDVGKAQRNLIAAMACAYILEKVGIGADEPCLDWGGAEGLFCRFMRDRGFNFRTYDKYVTSVYSAHFAISNPADLAYAGITAFEVLAPIPKVQLKEKGFRCSRLPWEWAD